MIKAGDPVSKWLQAKLPASVLERINPAPGSQANQSKAENNEWAGLLKSYAIRVVLYSVILVAILILSRTMLTKAAQSLLPFLGGDTRKAICLGVTLIVMVPFLYGLVVTNGSINTHASKLLKERPSNRWPILSLLVLRIMLGIGFILAAITSYFKLGGWGVLIAILAGLFVILVAKFSV